MGVVPKLSASLLALAGCGRLEFDPLAMADAQDGDAAIPDTSMPACDPAAPFGTPVKIEELSDPTLADGTLRLMPDERSGYFWSGAAGAQRIFFVTRATLAAPFTVTATQGLDVVGGGQLDPAPSSDGSVMVFRRTMPGDELFVATRIAPAMFDTPVAIAALNTTSSETQSFLPIGIDELYFQSKRTAAGDIYTSARSGTSFAAPSLVAELATPAEEGDPVVTPDGLTIYFRSNTAAARLGFNIFSASRTTPDGVFGPATLVDAINTDSDDGASWISPDGCRLYLSSDIDGSNDVYVATRGM